MEKRKCLFEGCDKMFQPKRESAKFCSDTCRVKHSYKNKGKNQKKKESDILLQMQVISNTVLGAIELLSSKIEFSPITNKAYKGNSVNRVIMDEAGLWEMPKEKRVIVRSAEQWLEQKRECSSTEEWLEIKAQIEAATNLSPKTKQLIFNTP